MKRIKELDFTRVIAMFAVVMIHVTSTYINQDSSFILFDMNLAFILNQVSRFSVPLFIVLSGISLGFSKPIGDPLLFYKKRLVKIGIPYEIKGNFVPTWLPEGFELYGDVSIQVYPEFGEVEFFASYLEGEEIFSISITKCSNSFQANTYEKTFQNPEIYVVDDIEHYIVDNSDTILAAWYVNNIECSINTTMSESDLKRVIDSIYEE